ncbi:MAG: hypothetical protein ABFC57_15535 [Veillonellales bacterium]
MALLAIVTVEEAMVTILGTIPGTIPGMVTVGINRTGMAMDGNRIAPDLVVPDICISY